jgi:hypothetical protein
MLVDSAKGACFGSHAHHRIESIDADPQATKVDHCPISVVEGRCRGTPSFLADLPYESLDV